MFKLTTNQEKRIAHNRYGIIVRESMDDIKAIEYGFSMVYGVHLQYAALYVCGHPDADKKASYEYALGVAAGDIGTFTAQFLRFFTEYMEQRADAFGLDSLEVTEVATFGDLEILHISENRYLIWQRKPNADTQGAAYYEKEAAFDGDYRAALESLEYRSMHKVMIGETYQDVNGELVKVYRYNEQLDSLWLASPSDVTKGSYRTIEQVETWIADGQIKPVA